MKRVFMVEFDLPTPFTEEFINLIPQQRSMIDGLLAEGKIRSYSLSEDRSRLWTVFVAESEFEVMELIAQMPLSKYMEPSITQLMFHNASDMVLQFSLN